MKRQVPVRVVVGVLLFGCGVLLASEDPSVKGEVEETGESGVPAEKTEPQRNEVQERWWRQTNLLGDLNGRRSELLSRGLNLSLYYNSFAGVQAKGGKSDRSFAKHSGSVDFFLQADLGKLGMIPGGEVLMQVKNNHGRNINPFVGAVSDPFDDADFYEPIYIDQLWYQQTFMQQKAQLRFGYLDLQTIIDRNAYANSEDKQFMTTFLDNDNSMVPLMIGLGATMFLYPTDWLALTAGIIDADNKILHAGWDTAFDGFDSLMIFFETGLKSRISSKGGPLEGNYRFGILLDPRDKVAFSTQGVSSPQTDSGDVGVYASLDQMLVPEQDDASQGLGVFFRWGHRTPDVNRISDFWSTGLQYRGLLQGRDEDLMGLALYSVSGSGDYRTFVDPGFERETGCEVYYSFQLTPWLTFSPDFQFIDNPGAREAVRDAMIFGFRTRVTF